MTQSTEGIHSILSNPRVYWLYQVISGGGRRQATFVRDYLHPIAGMRILDIGCGPGQMLRLMPQTDYVGYDLNPGYVEAARRRFGDQAEFQCADVTKADMNGGSFDAVIANGLLHHLDDEGVDRLMEAAAAAIHPEGRVLTSDPTRLGGSSRLATWLIRHDRGRDIRRPEGYAELGRRRFAKVSVSVENQRMLPPLVPWRYPFAVMECREPR
jgi:2-polyprenyl-3-methyl-5-hydroxy-6-metoxy-1,4-benzoquinol methylase